MSEDRSGYVYLLKAHKPFEECYKIGRTADPKQRFKTFGVKLPYKVDLICAAKTDDMFRLEAAMHERFAHCRLDGEWFQLTPEEVADIHGYMLYIQAYDLYSALNDLAPPESESMWDILRDLERITRIELKALQRTRRRFSKWLDMG
jgi:hypothetical protein